MEMKHPLRDGAITAVSIYFCAQSFFIVFRMWTELSFSDKVSAMETVILTSLVLCEALNLLYCYKFDETKSAMFAGELHRTERRIQLNYGDLARIRGPQLIRTAAQKLLKIDEKRGKFASKHLLPNRDNMENDMYKELIPNIVEKLESDYKSVEENIFNNLQSTVDEGFYSSKNIQKTRSNINKFPRRKSKIVDVRCKSATSIWNLYGDDDLYERRLDEGVSRGDCRMYKEFFCMKSTRIIQKMFEKNVKVVRTGLTVFKFLSVSLLLVPLLSFVSYITGFIEFEEIQLSFLVYIPLTGSSMPENITQYALVVLIQTLYVYLFYTLSSDSFMVAVMCNATLKTEIKLFLNKLEEFDVMFFMDSWNKMEDSLTSRLRNLTIWEKFKHIVEHHQVIYREVASYKELVEKNAVYIHSAICVELCIALFLLQGELFFKVKYSVVSVSLCMGLALYSEEGQSIADGFEEMRDALYRISWHNMSVSLRKSLVILLTRHSLPLTVSGSYGIFVINRKNFSMIMRASYSYLNLLNRIK